MAKKETLQPAEPATNPEVAVQAAAEENVIIQRAAEQNVPLSPPKEEMEMVRTGVDIRTGAPVMKAIPVRKAASVQWNTGDRAGYIAHTAGTGSLNGRRFDFKAGDKINLNADEAKLFKDYVTKAAK